ncbi:MAG: hypothetical protein CMJ26_06255 [Phycisphaerae bacterium]|nr:hypothetical protein [Phycisphaerae bacterium]|tara:strand:+ start:5112 stop:5411 length:300 start_codon:yes stop_codon:yes gene_type:complete
MTIQASNFEQHTGFAFNSNDFSMHSASGSTLLPMVTSAMMEDWDSEHNEDEDAPKIEIDPDLEDGDDEDKEDDPSKEDGEVIDDDDDAFENYLFGDDDD